MRWTRSAKPQDLVSAVFLLGLILLVLIARDRLTNWQWLLARYAALLGLQGLVVAVRGRTRSPFFPALFPLVPVYGIYDSLGFIAELNPTDRDGMLIWADRALLGRDPSLWFEGLTTPWLTEILQLAYLVYYFLPFVLLGILYRRGYASPSEPGARGLAVAAFDLCVVALLLSHYLAFIGYMLVPALGPRFTLTSQSPTRLPGLLVAGAVRDLLDALEGIKRDAFPSGHTSAALICLYYAFRFAPRLGRYALPAVALMIVATIYLRYHYVVDILAGGILAGVCILLTPRLLPDERHRARGRPGVSGGAEAGRDEDHPAS